MVTESEAKSITKQLEELCFTSLKVGFFDPTASFSHVTFTIETDHVIMGKALLCIDAAALMGESADFPGKEALEKFLTVLPTLDANKLSQSQSATEARTFVEIAKHLLCKLSEKVVLSSDDYSALLKEDPSYVPPYEELPSAAPCTQLSLGLTGMGEIKNTWHGTPDARVRAYQNTEIAVVRGRSSNVSPVRSLGDSVVFEAKREPMSINRHQLIATTVVSSFIERNLHRNSNPMVPVILITIPTVTVCLYDCTRDLLLISDELKWINVEDDTFNTANLFVIWLFIHHRFVAMHSMACIIYVCYLIDIF